MSSYVCYADHTAYPHIYRNSSWGSLTKNKSQKAKSANYKGFAVTKRV